MFGCFQLWHPNNIFFEKATGSETMKSSTFRNSSRVSAYVNLILININDRLIRRWHKSFQTYHTTNINTYNITDSCSNINKWLIDNELCMKTDKSQTVNFTIKQPRVIQEIRLSSQKEIRFWQLLELDLIAIGVLLTATYSWLCFMHIKQNLNILS